MSTTVQRHHVEAWLGDTYPDPVERDQVVDAILATGSAWETDWLRAVAAHDGVDVNPVKMVVAADRDLTRREGNLGRPDANEALDRLEDAIHAAWLAGVNTDTLQVAAYASLPFVLSCIPELDT